MGLLVLETRVFVGCFWDVGVGVGIGVWVGFRLGR